MNRLRNINQVKEPQTNKILNNISLSPEERLKIIANVVIDRILEEQKNGTIKLTVLNN